ncbi:two-component sensor histidine kinase [Actinokineospora bangkokensis]|uniref:histidine kinase n=1 Tax=Actinokineospora bangkokensis TaxID=1193682 RepID=A0A1Q9LKZ6_9PSEU|nr:two-component sensor histidine kinase [Actinokineospora bangkokensis]
MHRARLRVGGLVAVAVTLLVTLTGGLAYEVVAHAQTDQVIRELRYTADHAVPTQLPGCTFLYFPGEPGGGALPPGFPLRADLDAVRASGGAVERSVDANGTTYLVRTQTQAGGRLVQAVFDTRYQLADREHLLVALLIAEGVGLLAAAATGWAVGRRAVAPLAEALARQRRFVTDASHELRTPIARARTRAQLLARRAAAAGLPAEHRDGLDRLSGSLRGLGDIVDDLLLSARMAAGQASADGTDLDLAALTEAAVTAERERAEQEGVVLTVARPPEPLYVTGVQTALRRAVGELLANAVRHTPGGGRVEVSLRRAAGQVELTVSDTGEGFAQDEAAHLFDRFHRGATGRDRQFGLGLALLREVVTSHRGTVEAVGHPGAGARFTLRFPEAVPRVVT